jgi:hypothetical protein
MFSALHMLFVPKVCCHFINWGRHERNSVVLQDILLLWTIHRNYTKIGITAKNYFIHVSNHIHPSFINHAAFDTIYIKRNESWICLRLQMEKKRQKMQYLHNQNFLTLHPALFIFQRFIRLWIVWQQLLNPTKTKSWITYRRNRGCLILSYSTLKINESHSNLTEQFLTISVWSIRRVNKQYCLSHCSFARHLFLTWGNKIRKAIPLVTNIRTQVSNVLI